MESDITSTIREMYLMLVTFHFYIQALFNHGYDLSTKVESVFYLLSMGNIYETLS